jgi:hypothetical protein
MTLRCIHFIVLTGCLSSAADGETMPNSCEEPHALPRGPSSRFTQLDTDRDGYISRTEALADSDLVAHFSRWDEAPDGRLNEKEFSEFAISTHITIPFPTARDSDISCQRPGVDVRPAAPPRDALDIAP